MRGRRRKRRRRRRRKRRRRRENKGGTRRKSVGCPHSHTYHLCSVMHATACMLCTIKDLQASFPVLKAEYICMWTICLHIIIWYMSKTMQQFVKFVYHILIRNTGDHFLIRNTGDHFLIRNTGDHFLIRTWVITF